MSIRKIRNFSYGADGGVRAADYYNRTFDIARLRSVMGYMVPTTESARWLVQNIAIAAHPVATAQRPICHARPLI